MAVGGCKAGSRAKDESRARRLIMFVFLICVSALREAIGRQFFSDAAQRPLELCDSFCSP